MPGRPDSDAKFQFHLLDAAWHDVQLHWRDDMMRHFDTHHRIHLWNESEAYVNALNALMEFLVAAERDTEY